MDGPRVAYAVEGARMHESRRLERADRLRGRSVSGPATCGADSTSTGGGVTRDRRRRYAHRLDRQPGREHREHRLLYTATLPRPREHLVASTVRTGDVDGTLTGGWIGGLVGTGDRIALNRWTTNASGEVATGMLQRLDAG